ncbi:MAG: thiol peroxidase [Thermodesulfobacteriales bacterium]|jgi:thiol peroxidase|nr:MAG: thiol peroxidase [Thermodesulfobacteriales bacterium]
MAEERTGVVTLKGNPLTLIGPEVKVGDKAPDFSSLKGLGAPITLADLEGKVKVFNVILSVDTPVCDVQTKRFNQEAANLGDEVVILTLSMDLPFALGRYCAAEGIDKVQTASDYKDASFGEAYGVLIKEHRLLARALFVVDKDDIVRYAEYVPEVATEPNYDPAIAAVKESL